MKLFDKLKDYSDTDFYPMHMPGHKRNSDMINSPLLWQYDITEIDGFDNLHGAEGILKDAQQRAADLFGAKHTFFSVNGSTAGILSAIRTCALMRKNSSQPPRALIQRNSHKSAYNALELCCVDAVFISPEFSSEYGIFSSVSPQKVEEAFFKYPDIAFCLITSPSYEGIVSDITSIAEIVHKHGAVLIVDEAHGSHMGFSDTFPKSAVQCGADIVIQSLHKTLPSLTQTALVHICSDRIDRKALARQLSVFQTSSPSYILMSSIDECVSMLSENADKLFDHYSKRLSYFYDKAENLKNLRVLPHTGIDNAFAKDASKIVIDTSLTYISGAELSDTLRKKYHIECEMCSTNYVLAMTSVCDTDTGFDRLYNALYEIDKFLTRSDTQNDYPIYTNVPQRYCLISDAIKMSTSDVKIADSSGCVSADYMWAYPPGIPLIAPGEIISNELLEYVNYAQKCGIDIHTSFSDSGFISICDIKLK